MEFDPSVVWRNLPALLDGAKLTVLSFLIALGIGMPLGALICAARLGERGPLAAVAQGYVTVMRATPEIVLIFWIFYCLPPIVGYAVSGLTAGSVALGLVAGAYLGEIFRAGVQSVPRGQAEAARALALSRTTIWTRIIGPQAARLSIPFFINYMTELLKGTTLLATIGVAELALKSYVLGAQTFRYMEFLSAIAIFYFIIIFPVARLAEWVEHRLAAATR
jgi:His/Glu/Gln/Arg/opine family amino acid ABC transporter permease subunit